MISSIRLQSFRSYKDASFEFEPSVNIVVGPNASGKTNLLEAVLVLARGSSYKAHDADLIEFGKDWARLDGFFGDQSRVLKLKTIDQKTDKTFLINSKPYKRLSLKQSQPAVIFEPNHLQSISRGPDKRREYLDNLLSVSLTGFKTLHSQYFRVLAQRNSLLKQNPAHAENQIFAWNVRLSELAAKVAQARARITDQINKNISNHYSLIANEKTTVEVVYDNQFPIPNYSSLLLKKLENSTKLDFERGFTAYGPHREDFIFYLNKKPANLTASRGETRSLLLALKIFELELTERVFEIKPILLLDDVFSELDSRRRRALVEYLKNHQTIITTTDVNSL